MKSLSSALILSLLVAMPAMAQQQSNSNSRDPLYWDSLQRLRGNSGQAMTDVPVMNNAAAHKNLDESDPSVGPWRNAGSQTQVNSGTMSSTPVGNSNSGSSQTMRLPNNDGQFSKTATSKAPFDTVTTRVQRVDTQSRGDGSQWNKDYTTKAAMSRAKSEGSMGRWGKLQEYKNLKQQMADEWAIKNHVKKPSSQSW